MHPHQCASYRLLENTIEFQVHPSALALIPGQTDIPSRWPPSNGMGEDDVSSSSFFDLKAEVLKRKREAGEARKSQSIQITKRPIAQLSSDAPRGNASGPTLLTRDRVRVKNAPLSDDAEAHARSHAALETKSRLYERLQNSELALNDSDRESSCLVDFDRKGWDPVKKEITETSMADLDAVRDPVGFLCHLWSLDETQQPCEGEEELVEYIDDFGRARKIRASERAQFDAEKEETARLLNGLFIDQGLEPKHYDPNWEVRDKGIGFFSFSRDIRDRQKQLQALRDLRQRTVESRARAAIAREEQRIRREGRIAKAHERRTRGSTSEGSSSLFASLLGSTR